MLVQNLIFTFSVLAWTGKRVGPVKDVGDITIRHKHNISWSTKLSFARKIRHRMLVLSTVNDFVNSLFYYFSFNNILRAAYIGYQTETALLIQSQK